MQIDVPTLYHLTVGTLCVAVAMTLWERKAHPRRAKELGIFAASYAILAAGCLVMMFRAVLPGSLGQGVTNVVFVAGYLLLLHGVLRLDGPGRPRLSILAVGFVAVVWLVFGSSLHEVLWHFGGSAPIALVHLAIAWRLATSDAARCLRSRPLAIAIAVGHGLFYAGRLCLMPLLAVAYGPEALALSAKATMFEAVLYSVAMPMAILALVREESQGHLLAASRTDYLTGLGNRHALFEEGERLLAAREQTVTLLAFDLDHFKAINDRHGHAAGDAVLKLFAETARSVLGGHALLARLGGEEFVALLPGINAVDARPLAEAVCNGFAAAARRPGGLAISATVSVGLAERGAQTQDLSRLLSAADRALYNAKSRGRNRVELAAQAA